MNQRTLLEIDPPTTGLDRPKESRTLEGIPQREGRVQGLRTDTSRRESRPKDDVVGSRETNTQEKGREETIETE